MMNVQERRELVYGAATRFFSRLLEENGSDEDARAALGLAEFLKDFMGKGNDLTNIVGFPDCSKLRRQIPVF